jgi:hypothetical protein
VPLEANTVIEDSAKKPPASEKGPEGDRKPPSKKKTPTKKGKKPKKGATVGPMEESLSSIITTQSVVEIADSPDNVLMANSVLEEVPFLESTAAMITQNPSPQDTGVTDSVVSEVPLVATAAMITQNPSSQDTGVAEVSLAAMASIFSSFYPSPQESESVSRALNFDRIVNCQITIQQTLQRH